jgi:hypothetical protein
MRADNLSWKSLPAGFWAGPGPVAGPNGKPDGVLAGPRGQKQKAKETENGRRQKLRRACPVSRRLLRGWFNNGLIRRSARLPLPNYGHPTRAPVDSILWWLGCISLNLNKQILCNARRKLPRDVRTRQLKNNVSKIRTVNVITALDGTRPLLQRPQRLNCLKHTAAKRNESKPHRV